MKRYRVELCKLIWIAIDVDADSQDDAVTEAKAQVDAVPWDRAADYRFSIDPDDSYEEPTLVSEVHRG